jgi:hypothetical protein
MDKDEILLVPLSRDQVSALIAVLRVRKSRLVQRRIDHMDGNADVLDPALKILKDVYANA